MDIKGLQKLTLLDYPGKVACTVFTGGCNFRCPFCHNASLVVHVADTPSIPSSKVLEYLKMRAGILDGVCITGGEPLMQKGIKKFLTEIKALGYHIKLDTNGAYPAVLHNLIAEKLVDYVAMDIKNSPQKYAQTVGCEYVDIDKIKQSVDILMTADIDYEFRTTAVKELHTDQDFADIGRWLSGCKAYFLQNYTDSPNVLTTGWHALSKNQLIAAKTMLKPYIDNIHIRGE